jgi:hypothetical protein
LIDGWRSPRCLKSASSASVSRTKLGIAASSV